MKKVTNYGWSGFAILTQITTDLKSVIKMIFLFIFFSFSTFATENIVEDSLIANIGKKAKVIFYAENKADFNEIAKYDLNKLFAEVRKRSEKNFTNNEEVTLREVDENLKNREVNTTVSPKKWFKNMNLNLFLGGTYADGSGSFAGETVEYNNKLVHQTYYSLSSKTSAMIGIGLFLDKKLNKGNKVDVSFRYGLGFDIINSKINVSLSGVYIYHNVSNDAGIKFIDSLRRNADKSGQYRNILSTNFFTQLMPTISLLNKKGQKTFSFGLGLKSALSLNNLRRLGGKNNFSDFGTTLFTAEKPVMNFRYRTLQTAWIANVGYKSINLFMQIQPNIGILRSYEQLPQFNTSIIGANERNVNSYIIGFRFGK